jgi:hypothetical protein
MDALKSSFDMGSINEINPKTSNLKAYSSLNPISGERVWRPSRNARVTHSFNQPLKYLVPTNDSVSQEGQKNTQRESEYGNCTDISMVDNLLKRIRSKRGL